MASHPHCATADRGHNGRTSQGSTRAAHVSACREASSHQSPTVEVVGGLLHPTGPMPPHIYWVRRILVLGLAAVILVTAWWVFVRGGAKDPVTATTVRTSVQNSNSASPGSPQCASGSSVAAMSAPPVGSSASS